MQLVKNLLFILILIISVVFIIDLMEKNNDNFIKETYLKNKTKKVRFDKDLVKCSKPFNRL